MADTGSLSLPLAYRTSFKKVRWPAVFIILVVGYLVGETVQGLVLYHFNPIQWFEAAVRLPVCAVLVGIMAHVHRSQDGRTVTLEKGKVVCTHGNDRLEVPYSQLIVQAPKRGAKSGRRVLLSDGTRTFEVLELYCSNFDDMLKQLAKRTPVEDRGSLTSRTVTI